MGRYDSRIKVFNGSYFQDVQQIRVWDGSWIDFGNNSSYSTRSMYVRDSGGVMRRLTRNRRDVQNSVTYDDDFGYGQFNGTPASGFCYYTQGGKEWRFSGTFMKTAGGDQQLFRCGSGNTNISVTWLNDGRIRVGSYYNSQEWHYSSNAVGLWEYCTVSVVMPANSTKCTITLNGASATKDMYQRFIISNATTQVGNPNVRFRGDIIYRGYHYTGTTYNQATVHHTAYGGGTNHGAFNYSPKTTNSWTDVYWD